MRISMLLTASVSSIAAKTVEGTRWIWVDSTATPTPIEAQVATALSRKPRTPETIGCQSARAPRHVGRSTSTWHPAPITTLLARRCNVRHDLCVHQDRAWLENHRPQDRHGTSAQIGNTDRRSMRPP